MQIDRLHPNEVRRLLGAQKAIVEQVSCTLGPHGPVKLAQSLRETLEMLEQYFEKHLLSIEASPAREFEQETAVQVFARYLEILHDQYLRYLLPADPYSFPGELLHPIKDLLIRFGGYEEEKTSFGILHWHKYNFGVAGFRNPLTMILEQIKTDLLIEGTEEPELIGKNLPERLIFFTYPEAEGRNVFLQAILFHELGHAIDWQASISAKLLKVIKWTDNASNLPNIFRDWVREITADLVAARLIGPCVLFSSRLAALTVGALDTDSLSHPSMRFRFLWMLEHLEKLGYLKAQSGVATPKILRNWHADLKQHPAKNHDETTPTASEFATVRSVLRDAQVITALHSSIEQWLPKPTYDAEIFRVQVPSIVANFQDQLPHCGEGIDSAIHMASVFNAAWEARFAIESEQTTVADITSEQEMLCGLALKSIEGNYIQNLWNQ